MNRFIGQSPGGSTILITLQKVTGTVTHKVYNTSILRCSLYEFSEQVCLVLGLGFCYSVGLSSIQYHFSRSKLAPRRPDMQHSVQRDTPLFLRLPSKHVFRCCVNNLYPSVVTETFLYVLPRNRCLCHNLGDVFQQAVTWQWIYMSQYWWR
jgi:hypothetical protein